MLDLDDGQAARARLVVEPEMAELAETGKASASGTPTVKRRRKAAERLRGMFAHVAPGVSLADELIADRRAEVREEERAETERRRIDG